MKPILQRLLKEKMGVETLITSLTKLHGDASNRIYYRAVLADGERFVIMQLPQGTSSASEEITNLRTPQIELPFVNVTRFLVNIGIPTPKIHLVAPEEKIIVLEDIGDELFLKGVEGKDMATQRAWYVRALDLLVSMQQSASAAHEKNCIAFQRSFDATLLNWEFDHFLEYGLQARGISLSDADQRIFHTETRKMTDVIVTFPATFTHRDFQSKNIMMHGGSLVLIDFQDALMGPAVYDLVALTRDSYVEIADDLQHELVQYYAKKVGRNEADVKKECDLVTIQRKLKDAGRFVYIDRVKRNSSFLQYIPRSLRYVQRALQEIPEHHRLLSLLERLIPQWQ